MTREQASVRVVNSFRPEFAARLPNFRTPSPPTDALEPLSPPPSPLSQYQPSIVSRKRRRIKETPRYNLDFPDPAPASKDQDLLSFRSIPRSYLGPNPPSTEAAQYISSRSSPTALDVFAAVATSPSLSQGTFSPALSDQPLPTNSTHLNQNDHFSSHHSRKISSDYRISHSRHQSSTRNYSAITGNSSLYLNRHNDATSPNLNCSSGGIKIEDAELLLNFSRAATDLRSHWSVTDHYRHHYSSQSHQSARQSSNTTKPPIQPPQTFQDGPADPQKKPRVHKGWPKGKPRGKRTNNASQAQVKKPAAKKIGRPGKPGRPPLRVKQARIQKEQQKAIWSFPSVSDLDLPRRPVSVIGYASSHKPSQFPTPRQTTRSASVPADIPMIELAKKSQKMNTKSEPKVSICEICTSSTTPNGYNDLWIICNGCKKWSHTICAGFKTEREVRDVDKFYCPTCESDHGKTTFVRKSSRAHAAVDYAGLNEGQLRAPPDSFEHHFIKPIKEGTIKLLPEKFPRMPPELVTAEFFEKSGNISEPIIIPAALNPRPWVSIDSDESDTKSIHVSAFAEDKESIQPPDPDEVDYDCVPDDGQDHLDMVMPKGLTVRHVAEILGPERPIQVIETKSQDSGNGPWNLSKWADYYEATGEKPVRNVISLEVSRTKLSRLVRRPKVVRDLDLTDQVWPVDELANGSYPHVQYYCLMSVADCFTDFHIDFGGSSVFYHILRGKKTFFFIPPKKTHLKKYEEWCISPSQASIWLGDVTKECYRVDLSEGDTMLIPSGWIHAVWTPETSLVIGGNFLTRMHYSMQLQINEIEKNTQVAKMFRYPYFQRVMWYAVVQYLQDDPVPSTVAHALYAGEVFDRQTPIYLEFCDNLDESSDYYNSRYYSQGEVEGLGDLLAFVFRTIMIAIGRIPLPRPKQEAVIRSLPSGYGDHLELLRVFALWVAWKRGNEKLPTWAHVHAPLSELDVAMADKTPGVPIGNPKSTEPQRRPGPGRKRKVVAETPVVQNLDDGGLDPDADPPGPHWCQSCRMCRFNCVHKDSDSVPTQFQHFGIREIVPKPPVSPIDVDMHILNPENLANVQTPSDESSILAGADVDPISEHHTPNSNPMDGQSSGTLAQARIKACEECRKSKRRCVHDAAGNIDPVKAMQNPVPRAFSATKRIRQDHPTSGQQPNKRIKSDPAENDAWAAIRTTPDLLSPNVKASSAFTTDDQTEFASGTQTYSDQGSIEHLQSGPSHTPNVMDKTETGPLNLIVDASPLSPGEAQAGTPSFETPTEAQKPVTNSNSLQAFTNFQRNGTVGQSHVADEDLNLTVQRSESQTRSRSPSVHIQTTSTESVDRSTSPATSLVTDIDHPSPDNVLKNRKSNETTMQLNGKQSGPQVTNDDALAGGSQALTPSKELLRKTPRKSPKSETPMFVKTLAKAPKDSARNAEAVAQDSLTNGATRSSPDTLAYTPLIKAEGLSLPIEEEEDESLKLARQLQEQEFSLRRRRGSR